MSSSIFNTGAHYNFETLAPAILGARFENVKCISETIYEDLLSQGFQIGNLYRRVYPFLKVGTPDVPELVRYYKFKTQTGSDIIMSEQWVDLITIEEVSYINFQINFERSTPEQLRKITQLLRGSDINNFSIVANK